MHSKVTGGEQCEVQHIPRAAQLLTVRAGRVTHWEEKAGGCYRSLNQPHLIPGHLMSSSQLERQKRPQAPWPGLLY